VAALFEATGTNHELRGRLAGGETGAHEIVAPTGESSVLKWETDPTSKRARRRGAELTEPLRVEAGWPVPRQQAIEYDVWLFIIQDFLPGSPVEVLSHALVDQVLDLHTRRLELDVTDCGDEWPTELIHTLTSGGSGYCLHEPLRSYDRRTASLLETIEGIGRSLDPVDLPGGDVVHWDLHPGNLLQVDGVLTAVVDTDFAAIEIALSDGPDPDLVPFKARTEVELRHRSGFTDDECLQVDRWGYNEPLDPHAHDHSVGHPEETSR
jgi:hypothetical protein